MKQAVPHQYEGITGRLAMALGGFAMLIVVLTALLGTLALRRDTTAAWRVQLDTLSLILAEHASQTMFSADTVLDALAESIRAAHIKDQAEFRRVMSDPSYFRLMRDKTDSNTFIDVATIVAANGDVLNFTRAYPHPPINLSDRDYFLAYRNDPALGAYTSAPVRNRADGSWVFYLSRRIDNARGELLGLLLVGVSVDVFSKFYAKVGSSLGEGAALALYRDDYTLMTRWPLRDDLVGQKNPSGAAALVVRDAHLDHDVIETEGQRFTEHNLGETRLVAPRKVARYPLITVPTITQDGYLRQWAATARLIASSTAVGCALIAWLTWVLVRRARARELSLARAVRLGHAAQNSAAHDRRLRHEAEHAADLLRLAGTAAQAASQAKTRVLLKLNAALRPPLNSVISMTQRVLDKLRQPETAWCETQRDYLETAHDSATRLLEVLDTTLEFVQLEHGDIALAPAAFDARVLVAEVEACLAERVSQKGLSAYSEIAADFPVQLIADRQRLRQLLLGLYDNAVKFTEIGWVKIQLRLHRDDSGRAYAHFAVEDSGIGIASSEQDALFEPFVQGERARHYGGAGLGLALCQQLAKLMGARLSVHSTSGLGSRFELLLPLDATARAAPGETAPAAAAAQNHAAAAPASAGAHLTSPLSTHAPLTALIAEDHPVHRKQLEALLAEWGHRFQSVEDGFAALRLYETQRFDYILMDTQMPFMDGIEAIRSIRATERERNRPRTAIIAITANDVGSEANLCGALGADACCAKPIVTARLKHCLDEVLGMLATQDGHARSA
jgi:signal transduction histidine kinase/ActR/RegA family two-component response regulator